MHYWTKPLNKALNVSMATRLFNQKERVKETIKLDNVDLLFGGNHGQWRFWMTVKVIVRNSSMTCIDEWSIKVAHINCKKDMYHVLWNTITPKLNEDLKLLMENDTKVPVFKNMVCHDGRLHFLCHLLPVVNINVWKTFLDCI